MDPSGRVSRRRAGRVAPFVFTGVELVSKRLFDNPPEGAFSMNLLWDRAIEAGRCYGISHQGLWFDVGTQRARAQTEAMITHGLGRKAKRLHYSTAPGHCRCACRRAAGK